VFFSEDGKLTSFGFTDTIEALFVSVDRLTRSRVNVLLPVFLMIFLNSLTR
jgi:hypothetical protein